MKIQFSSSRERIFFFSCWWMLCLICCCPLLIPIAQLQWQWQCAVHWQKQISRSCIFPTHGVRAACCVAPFCIFVLFNFEFVYFLNSRSACSRPDCASLYFCILLYFCIYFLNSIGVPGLSLLFFCILVFLYFVVCIFIFLCFVNPRSSCSRPGQIFGTIQHCTVSKIAMW